MIEQQNIIIKRKQFVKLKKKELFGKGIYLLMIMMLGLLLCGPLMGCSNQDQKQNAEAELAEDIVISTDYGALHYPTYWKEYVNIQQKQKEDVITVTFQTEIEDKDCTLFEILIGDCDGTIVGSLEDADGVQRNVYLKAAELPETIDMSEDEESRFYAMQEDLNYLIDNLK